MTFKKLHKNIKIRIIEHFFTVMIGSAIFPFMGIYLAVNLGHDITGIALLINAVVGIIASLYGGYLADKYGRKAIMIKAEIIRIFTTVVMALAASPLFEAPWVIYITMILFSACSGMSRPASEAMIIDSSTSEERKYIYNIRYWSYHLAMIVGAVGGALLFKSSLFLLILIITLISIISLILLKYYVIENYIPDEDFKENENSTFKGIFLNYRIVTKNTIFKIFILASFLYLCLETQYHNYSAVRYNDIIQSSSLFNVGDFNLIIDGIKLFAILNIVNGLTIVLGGIYFVKLIKRLTNFTLINLGLIIYTLGYSILAISREPWILIIVMCLLTLGELMFVPSIQALLADIIPEQKRSSYLAINGLVFRVSTMVGTLSITIGSYVTPIFMGVGILLFGFISLCLFNWIINQTNSVSSNSLLKSKSQ